MDKGTALGLIYRKLEKQLHCSKQNLEEPGIYYVINEKEQKTPIFQVVAIGESVIVSVSESVKNRVMPFLENRTREELFECPFLYGQSIYYIPDFRKRQELGVPEGYTYRLIEGEGLCELEKITAFENAVDYDEQGNLTSKIAYMAIKKGKVIAIAGANEVFEGIWEVGVDVMEGYRGNGLASALVGTLVNRIMERGILPIYCASSTNIASQAVACRSGFMPTWVASYHTYLDNSRWYI